ncbi:MAG TPA: DUF418 domain-containing protein [Planctomycetes bacterium]|nr:DUF418 domain-containing protein [Planctomycetota bacterium]
MVHPERVATVTIDWPPTSSWVGGFFILGLNSEILVTSLLLVILPGRTGPSDPWGSDTRLDLEVILDCWIGRTPFAFIFSDAWLRFFRRGPLETVRRRICG